MPRYDFQAQTISHDFGDYSLYQCNAQGESCEMRTSLDLMKVALGDKDKPDSVNQYLHGFVLHVGLPLLLAFFMIILGICLGLCRYCCCCCGRKRCVGGCCGKRYPTHKPAASDSRCKRWCSCGGVQPDLVAIADASELAAIAAASEPEPQEVQPAGEAPIKKPPVAIKKPPPNWAYSFRDRLCVFVFYFGFLFCVLLFIGLGFFSGVREMPAALTKATNDSPGSLLAVLANTQGPLGDFLSSLASESVVSAIVGFNATFNSAVNMQDVLSSADCILGAVDNLPSVKGLYDFVGETRSKLDALVVRVAGIIPVIDSDMQYQQVLMRQAMDSALVGPLNDLSRGVENARNATLRTRANLTAFDAAIDDLDTAPAGISSINNDLATLQTLPGSATVWALTGTNGVSNLDTLTRLINNGVTFSAGEATSLVARLQSMHDLYAALADYSATSTNLAALDVKFNALSHGRVIPDLFTSFTETTATLSDLNRLFDRLDNATTSFNAGIGGVFNISNEYSLIYGLNASLYSTEFVPDFAALQAQIDLLVDPLTEQVIPCLERLFSYVSSINATLMQLPASMDVAGDTLASVNSTLADAQAGVDSIVGNLNRFDDSRRDLNLASWITKLDSIGAQMRNQSDLVDGSYFNSMRAALNATNSLNFTTLTNQINQFNNTISSMRPDTSAVSTQLNTFQTAKTMTLARLVRVLADTTEFATTAAVTKRCHINPGTACPSDVPDEDAYCTPGNAADYCIVNTVRTNALITQLEQDLADSAALKPMGLSVSLGLTVIDTAANSIDTGALGTQLDESASKLVATNTTEFFSGFDAVVSRFGVFDLTDFNAQVDSLNNTITTIDYSSALDQLKTLNESLTDTATTKLQPLRDARALIYTFQQMMDVRFGMYVDQLSPSALRAARDANGVSGLVAAIAAIVDDASLFLSSNQPLLKFNTTTVADSASVRENMNILFGSGSDGAFAHSQGTLYQLARLGVAGNKDDYLSPLDADWGRQARYNEDNTGTAYLNGKKCVTKQCMQGSIEYVFGSSKGGGGATLREISGGSIPVNLTREQLQAIPLVLPLIVALLGCIAMCSYKYTSLSSCCSSCALCLLFPFAALLFLLSALMFPMLLLTGDVCLGLENLAYQAIVAKGDAACTSLAGGNGTARACVFSGFEGRDITVDVPQAALNIFGGRCAAGEDALARAWSGFSESVASYPQNQTDKFFNEQETKAAGDAEDSLVIRPQLQQPLRVAASHGGTLFSQFVARIGAESLGCAAMHDAWVGLKSPICCAVGTTIYWSLGTVYLLAWALLCCGFPALLIGRKRFPRKAWGPYVIPSTRYPPELADVPEEYKGGLSVDTSAAAMAAAGGAQLSPEADGGNAGEHAHLQIRTVDPSEGQGTASGAPQPAEASEGVEGEMQSHPVSPAHNPYALRPAPTYSSAIPEPRATTPSSVKLQVPAAGKRGGAHGRGSSSRGIPIVHGQAIGSAVIPISDVHSVEMTRPRSHSYEAFAAQQAAEEAQASQAAAGAGAGAGKQVYIPGNDDAAYPALGSPSGPVYSPAPSPSAVGAPSPSGAMRTPGMVASPSAAGRVTRGGDD